jgi:hypothetical protein
MNLRHTFIVSLLPLLLLLSSSVTFSTSRTLKYRSPPISKSGKLVGKVEVYDDEEPIDIIYDFCIINNLEARIKQGILNHACSEVECKRQKALLFSYDIKDENNQVVGTLTILDGDLPVNEINRFSRKLNLPYLSAKQLYNMACASERIQLAKLCKPNIDKLEVYVMDIPVDGVSQGEVVILEGQEPADVVYQFCRDRNLNSNIRQTIIKDACNREYITCTRENIVMFESGPIVVDGRVVGSITLTETTGEPIDYIHNFCIKNQLNVNIRNKIFEAACNSEKSSPIINCSRSVPAIYRNHIEVDGVSLGEFLVLEGEEPVDAVFKFYKLKHRLGPSVRRNLLNDICSKVKCTRNRAILYQSGPINVDGRLLKSFDVYENEQPADVAYIYSRHISPTLSRNIEDQLIKTACETIDINCTRTRALLVSKTVRIPGNCPTEEQIKRDLNSTYNEGISHEPCQPCIKPYNKDILILDGEEPVDQVNRFVVKYNLTNSSSKQHMWRNAILREVCNNHGLNSNSIFKIVCTRTRPLVYQTTVQHGESNQQTSELTILEDEIPSQIIYSFASKHGLPFTTIEILMKNICSPPLGKGPLTNCGNSSSRYQNIVFQQPIQIDNRTIETPLTLRDDTREPADVVDEYCLKHKIKSDMRDNIIKKVCSSGQVVCSRLKPVIYRWPFINFTTGEVYGEVEILQGDEVVDKVHLYLLKLNHPLINRTKMEKYVVQSACKTIEKRYGEKCKRYTALYYENQVSLDNRTPDEPMRIWGNDIEPVDQIYQYCRKYQLNRDIQTAILNDACRPHLYPGIRCTRAEALVYTKTLSVKITKNCSVLFNATTNKTEITPITDSAEKDQYEVFKSGKGNWDENERWRRKNVSEITTMEPRTIEVYQTMQVADVMEVFRRNYNDTINYTVRNQLIIDACHDSRIVQSWDTQCTRYIPRLIEQPLHLPASMGSQFVGVLSIFEPGIHNWTDYGVDQVENVNEIADQILAFSRKSGLPNNIRRNLIHNMCDERIELRIQATNKSMCNRRYSLLMNSSITLDGDHDGIKSGTLLGPIEIWGHLEPADQIDRWTYSHGYSYEVRDALVSGVCKNPLIQPDCTRTIVSHWSVNVAGQLVEFLEGQEATDLLYQAFRQSGQMQWQRYRVLDIACSQPRMICERKGRALLGSNNIRVNESDNGLQKLVLWELGSNQIQMIDMVYQFGIDNNMSYRQRWQLARSLCGKYGGHCSRSVAIVGWIPVNRDENITCPKSIYDRPYDNNDLLKLLFKHQKELAKKFRDKLNKYDWKGRDKNRIKFVSHSIKWINKHVLFDWNRTSIFEGSIHANESFPIPWLIVDFDRYIAVPYMVSLGWIPIILVTIGRGIKILEPQNHDDKIAHENVEIDSTKNQRRKRKKVPKISQKKSRRGRNRTKTPIRITAYVDSKDGSDDENEDNQDNQENQKNQKTKNFILCFGQCCVRCCHKCCCCSCIICNYTCRKYICSTACCKKYDRSRIRPSIVSTIICSLLCYGHFYLVSHVYTDVLHGFFILSPHVEASKYFDTNAGNYMGDLIVLENQAPIDALYEFASSFGTYGEKYLNTPILRRPRYWDLFRQLCEENRNLDCSRRIPREEMLQDISVNQHGYKLSLSYLRPLDPTSCKNTTIGSIRTTTCVQESATNFCNLLDPEPPGCLEMFVREIIKGLTHYENILRWDGKQQYRAIEMTRDVSNGTIRQRVRDLTRKYAIPCMKGPHEFGHPYNFKEAWKRVHKVDKIIGMIDDPDERDFYDQPCRVIFGAMCARTKPSGDMLIEQMN